MIGVHVDKRARKKAGELDGENEGQQRSNEG